MDDIRAAELETLVAKTQEDYFTVLKTFMDMVPIQKMGKMGVMEFMAMAEKSMKALDNVDHEVLLNATKFSSLVTEIAPYLEKLLEVEVGDRLGKDPEFRELVFRRMNESQQSREAAKLREKQAKEAKSAETQS